jgi:uncharacterized protein (TIGR02217 family)
MAFDHIVFPLMIERGTSSLEFSTTIIPTGSGAEQRIGNWLDARVIFNASLGIRSRDDIIKLVKFFRARKGRLRGFLIKDLLDHTATGDPIGTGDGVKTEFQLLRVYSDATTDPVYGLTGNTDNRPIYKPISGTVNIYKGVTLQAAGTNYTLDYKTGIVTFTTPPANGVIVTWSGQFYVPCRFAEDSLPADEIFYDYLEGKAAGGIPDILILETRDYQ